MLTHSYHLDLPWLKYFESYSIFKKNLGVYKSLTLFTRITSDIAKMRGQPLSKLHVWQHGKHSLSCVDPTQYGRTWQTKWWEIPPKAPQMSTKWGRSLIPLARMARLWKYAIKLPIKHILGIYVLRNLLTLSWHIYIYNFCFVFHSTQVFLQKCPPMPHNMKHYAWN